MNVEIELKEGFMVLSLFLGYLALWRLKKRKMLRHTGDNTEVIYDDNRPTQKFFANLSRVRSVFIALLIVLHQYVGHYPSNKFYRRLHIRYAHSYFG